MTNSDTDKRAKTRTDLKAKPTLKTIASLSGMAVPTVSRALGNAPDISAKTKAKIRKIADEIGYIPNRAGLRLRTGRTNVISLVMSTEQDMMNQTARLITAVGSGLRNTQYHLNVTPFFPGDDPMTPIRYIVENGTADAVIINQILPDDPRVAYLMERQFPFAAHGRSNLLDQHAYYDFDNETFARLGIEELVKRGRKNILMIAPPIAHNYAQEMVRGGECAAAEAGVKLCFSKRITSDSTNTQMREWVAGKVTADPLIDGFICGSVNATMAAVAGMESQGFMVGKNIDVVAKEAIPFLKFFRKEILVMLEDVSATGEFLARAAIKAVREPKAPPMQFLETPNDFISLDQY